MILKVDNHQAGGPAPLAQVEPQVQEAIYMSQLQPALRTYLTQARDDAFVEIKPGFTDSGSAHGDTRMAFTTYAPPPLKKKVVKKQAAEQAKAERAEQQLAEARAKVSQRQAVLASNAAGSGKVVNTSTSRRAKRVKREKVRLGQAPRNALPAGSTEVAAAVPSLGAAPEDANKALGGVAPGAAMGAPTQSITTVSTGTGEAENGEPLAPRAETSDKKTRFASREVQTGEKRAEVKLASAEVKATKRPTAATSEESADEKVQAAPLGLKEPTGKVKKAKRSKDQPKGRLQEQTKTIETPATVAPTVNSSLGATAIGDGSAPRTAKPSDTTTLPPASPTPNNPASPGMPIPATTSASPNSAPTTAQPPQ